MPASSPELEALFNQISYTTYGAARLPLLYQALELATATGNDDDLYRIRLALAESAARVDQTEIALAAFSWVVERHQADPARFPLHPGTPVKSGVDWMFGWILELVARSTAANRAQLNELMDLMSTVFRRNGLPLGKVDFTRFRVALELGDQNGLAEFIQAEQSFDRSNACSACVDANIIKAHLHLGDSGTAFKLAAQLLASGDRCEVEPEATLGSLVVPLLLNGSHNKAADYFDRARHARWDTPWIRINNAAHLIEAACLTGNLGFALQLFEFRLPDLAAAVHQQSPCLDFVAAGALLMQRTATDGHGERLIRDPAKVLQTHQIAIGPQTVASLAPLLWKEAVRLATALDDRAENTAASERLAKVKSLAEVAIQADLGIDEALSFTVGLVAPQTSAEWAQRCDDLMWLNEWPDSLRAADQAMRLGGLDAKTASNVHAILVAALAQVLQEGSGVTSLDQLGTEDLVAVRAAFDQYRDSLTSAGLTGRLRIAETLGMSHYNLDWRPTAAELMTQMDILASQGLTPAELYWLETSTAAALLTDAQPEQAAATAISAFTHSSDAVTFSRTGVQLQTGLILAGAGDGRALEWFTAVIDDPDATQGELAVAERARSLEYLRRSHFGPAADDAASASQRCLSLGSSLAAIGAVGLQTAALRASNDHLGAVRTLRRSLELSALVEDFDQVPLQFELAQALLASDQADSALAALAEADRLLMARGEALTSDAGFECAFLFGQAFAANGDPSGAANVLSQALEMATEAEHHGAQFSMARQLSSLYADYELWDDALQACLTERDAVTKMGDDEKLLSVDQRIGILRCYLGDASGLAELQQVEQRAVELGQSWWAAVAIEARAKGLNSLGHSDQAVAAALEASDAYGRTGDEPRRLHSAGLAARFLTATDQIAQARVLLRPLVEESELGSQILGEQLSALDG